MMARGRKCLALLAMAALLGEWDSTAAQVAASHGVPQALANLRSAEAAVTARTQAWDGFALDESKGSPGLLEAQWAAARRWTIAWLDAHPGDGLAGLVDVAKHDGALDVSAVRLDRDALVISAQAEDLGTVFIVRRGPNGRLITSVSLDEPNSWGDAGSPALGAWRSDRANGGCRSRRTAIGWAACGPITPAFVARLSSEADGARRFVVVGRYVKGAGATDGYQLSIWRWNGHTAEPLLVKTLNQMDDDLVVADIHAQKLTVNEKGEFKRMFACGACSGRQMEVAFDLPARGARLATTRSLVPDLDIVDDLYNRMLLSQPTGLIATPAVASALAETVKKIRADSQREKLPPSLGMLMGWKSIKQGDTSTLCLSADALDTPQLFTIETRGPRRRVVAVRSVPDRSCEGPGASS